MVSISYRSEMSRWIDRAERGYGTSFSALRSALDSDMSDTDIYQFAVTAENSVKQRKQVKKPSTEGGNDPWMHLKIVQYKDGVVHCINPITGKVHAAIYPERNGFSYVGPASMIQKLGGRGELSQLVTMLEDGDYIHTLKGSKEKSF